MRILVEILEDQNANLKKGDRRRLRPDVAMRLIKRGVAKNLGPVDATIKKATEHIDKQEPEIEAVDLTSEEVEEVEEVEECEACDGEGCPLCEEAPSYADMSYNELLTLDIVKQHIAEGGSRKKEDILEFLGE